jgi:threonine/homoserine/homoserine lactone efflux protein
VSQLAIWAMLLAHRLGWRQSLQFPRPLSALWSTQALRNVGAAAQGYSGSHLVATSRIFIDGIAVALLNPKTTLFFAAFLPQFLSGDVNPIAQSLVLSVLFVAIAAMTDMIYALTAARAARFFARRLRWRASTRYLTGGTLLGLGLFTALSDARNDK